MINNLKVNKNFFKTKIVAPLLIVGSLVTSGIIVKSTNNAKKENTINCCSLSTIVDNNRENNYFDDYYEYDDTYTLLIGVEDEKVDVDVYEAIDSITNLNGYETDLNLQLICEATLKRVIKSQVGGLMGLEPSEYENCKISPVKQPQPEGEYPQVSYYDKERKMTYRVEITEKSGVYYEALNSLWNIQHNQRLGIQELNITNFLSVVKRCLATDTTINNKGQLIDLGLNEELVKTLSK